MATESRPMRVRRIGKHTISCPVRRSFSGIGVPALESTSRRTSAGGVRPRNGRACKMNTPYFLLLLVIVSGCVSTALSSVFRPAKVKRRRQIDWSKVVH